ncbi:hypothetical protein M3B43_01010 [Nesterenkonia massiliensis]|uniref:ATP-grasp domain-containing protein n=1 Tax=Nesterenkonia massiliensis TaxID=1232429 RepID=A0ABT2HMK1_9MICC|nr:ATP-grasp fold amidoligase family protein [Nesterenkonia massiliensis]MCT1605919.1 hypothetical protein [Nesterenkonia massiliensis]
MTDAAHIQALTQRKKDVDREVRRQLTQSLKRLVTSSDGSPEYHNAVQELLDTAQPEHVELWMLSTWAPKAGLDTSSFVSWRTMLAAKTSHKGPQEPVWRVDDKRRAYEYVDSLGVRRPWIRSESLTLAAVTPEDAPFVLKPATGDASTGVFLVFNENQIFSVKDGNELTSWPELLDFANRLLLQGKVARDSWIIEELVTEHVSGEKVPASNLKFYSFYGEIMRVDEIRRFPKRSTDFFNSDGTRMEKIPFRTPQDERHAGLGFKPSDLETVKELSLNIPAAFVRIDMLRSDEGLVFGEFTPAPGTAAHLTSDWDIRMGRAHLSAQLRLQQDLLSGKDFGKFWSDQ